MRGCTSHLVGERPGMLLTSCHARGGGSRPQRVIPLGGRRCWGDTGPRDPSILPAPACVERKVTLCRRLVDTRGSARRWAGRLLLGPRD